MPIAITTGKFSPEAVRGMLSKPEDRAIAISKLAEAAGGKLLHYYFTTGEMDFLVISEGEDITNSVAATMVSAASGAVTDVRTVQAWTSAEFVQVAKKAAQLAAAFRAPGKG